MREIYIIFERERNSLNVSVWHSLILPWTCTYKLIERPHFLGTSGIGVKIESVLKNFWSLVLNSTIPRYTLLFLYSEIYIIHVINCEWSRSINFLLRMSCMRYKHVFFQQHAVHSTCDASTRTHLYRDSSTCAQTSLKCISFRPALTLLPQTHKPRYSKRN